MPRDPAEPLEIAALVALGSELEVECELESLSRIASLLRDTRGTARARWRFHAGADFAAAEGHVEASLRLTCQRCLGEVTIPVDAECRLVFADGEAAGVRVPAGHELVTTQGGRISLADLVEDELLLALPLVAVHRAADACKPQAGVDAHGDAPRTQRPFAGLRELMKHRQ